jgi:hypothetical protein
MPEADAMKENQVLRAWSSPPQLQADAEAARQNNKYL